MADGRALMAGPAGTPPPVQLGGRSFERTLVQTHLIHIKEPLEPLLDSQVRPLLKQGDWVAISEKVVAISEGRVVHFSVVRPGPLAKLIVKGTRKYEHDVAFSDPRKMQVAIMQTGSTRAAFAMVVGGVTKLFGRHGDFYRIAGHRIAEIDGFNPDTVAPFNEFAMLGPADPDKACAAYARFLGHPVVIIDGNNINVEVLGMSPDMPVDKASARLILLDNPMGQGDELTPFVIVHPAGGPPEK
ncbi:MAG: coenzyme F420-0:L-glutamate ligase [Acidimicrobiales bacterium]